VVLPVLAGREPFFELASTMVAQALGDQFGHDDSAPRPGGHELEPFLNP
jgi:hypothetical protein